MKAKSIEWAERKLAIDALKAGELVAFPTETVYGLGAISSSEEAFKKLVAAKKRPPEKPFTLMCSSIGQAVQYGEIDVGTVGVMQKFMPGEITLLLKARENLPHWLTLGSPFIGVRVPNDENVLAMIEEVGAPLLVPSANISGEAPAVTGDQVMEALGEECRVIVQGKCISEKPSTIVKVEDGKISLVREGPIAFEEILRVYEDTVLSVSLGSDHGGLDYKNKIAAHLLDRGFLVHDFGTCSPASCDYPEFAIAAANAVSKGNADLGILVCTSGEGISIAANKVKGIRCGIGYSDEVTQKCREHNNANMVAFGQKYMDLDDVLRRVDIFVSEKFSPLEKHHRRVKLIDSI